MLMGIEMDFSKLDAMDVLDLACFFEREAAETYLQLASWAGRRALFGDRPSRYSDAAPWEVEAPDFDKVGPSFTLQQAYELALGAEERAEAYFRQAKDYISDPQAVEILDGLADEELEHQRLLKAEMESSLGEKPQS
jgi:rubrerythrin